MKMKTTVKRKFRTFKYVIYMNLFETNDMKEETMQEMEIGFGKTAFSLDNQDGKLMVLFLSISFIVDYLS